MRVIHLLPLLAVGASARPEASLPIQESPLMRFLKHPFGLGIHNPANVDVQKRQPYSGRNDPLYLQTLNRSRAREGTLPTEESALMKFMKHPFGLGYKDPVKEHIQEPFRKHIKEPVKKGIKKLEKEDPLHLKSVNRNSAQYGMTPVEEEASARSSKVPYGFGRDDLVKEHVTDPVKRNIINPVKRSLEHPTDDDLRKLEHEDPLNADPLNRHDYATNYQTSPLKRESSVVRFFKHPFGLGRKDPIQEHITDPVKKNIIEPVKEHVTEPMKEQVRKLEREDPLHLKPLKRKVTNKLTNEGWARGRDPEQDERFLEIEETLMGTD
ncbi:hypothetical protein FisN_25Hh163 [Fistulifera solaris]|uniref:Uncharacterized protein n=1 Tax=Fistulifera solaris TaxID=1519565 RepID=A0A1Z5JW77_FISSO|nr:hypothetical protein FisN_25Hh163 [Fistulifera solaris]|eukprot:GAX18179.1 hypothetical protein FisN_25Hh163 [Fistulifera solaris]